MSYDPLPAAGAGADVFDLPSLFYLTNQAQIDEWHKLGESVSVAMQNWYRRQMLAALAAPALERGLELAEAAGPGSHRSVVLYEPGTPELHGKPVIGAGLAWTKGVNPTSNPPFVAVRCSRVKTGKLASETFLVSGGRECRTALPQARLESNADWPVWWWVRAEPRWWTDLDAYRALLVQNVLELVDAVREPLAAASKVAVVEADEAAGASDRDDE